MDTWSTFSSGPYGFKSAWRDKRNPIDAGIQTERLSYVETGCQAKVTSGMQTQTNPDPLLDFKEQKAPYPPSLYAFFAKVTDPMCEALAENLNPIYGLSAAMSALMADGDGGQDQAGTEETDTASKLYDLRSPNASEQCHGSCVAWNCQGAQVAIGYGESSHDGWCVHQAPLSVWSIGRLWNMQQQQQDDPNTGMGTASISPPPHKELILPACISAMQFHPTNPSLLAVGLHSGEVVLVDLHASAGDGDGTKKRATSGIPRRSASDSKNPDEGVVNADGIFHVMNRLLHSAEVVSIKWVTFPESGPMQSLARKNPSPAQHMILTGSKDGLIGLWSVNKTYNRLYLEKRIVILPRNLPEEITHKTQLSVSMKEMGVTALAPCKLDPVTFVVGTFGCYLFQGDVSSQDELDPSLELDVILPSRMTAELVNGNPRYLKQGRGYVNGLDYSPFHQNLVLASTIHGHVELINTLKPEKPVLELAMPQDEGLGVKWGGRPMVLGVGWANTLSVYDLVQSDATPAVNVEHKEPLSSFAFNKKELDLVATADESGRLHIWQLPTTLKTATDKQAEMDALIRLGNI